MGEQNNTVIHYVLHSRLLTHQRSHVVLAAPHKCGNVVVVAAQEDSEALGLQLSISGRGPRREEGAAALTHGCFQVTEDYSEPIGLYVPQNPPLVPVLATGYDAVLDFPTALGSFTCSMCALK